MIDVVFVIMLFFMVMANAVKTEQRLSLQLPGIPTPTEVKMPSAEITVGVGEDGSISLNDEVLGEAHDARLVSFTAAMMRLQQQAASLQDKLLITIQADEQASYQRVMDVLDVLAKAHILNITFTVGQTVGALQRKHLDHERIEKLPIAPACPLASTASRRSWHQGFERTPRSISKGQTLCSVQHSIRSSKSGYLPDAFGFP